MGLRQTKIWGYLALVHKIVQEFEIYHATKFINSSAGIGIVNMNSEAISIRKRLALKQ
jgi:hypothetical protein